MDRIAWTRSLVSISFIPVLLRGEALYEIPLVCNAAINSSCARLRGRSLHWRSAGAGAVRVHRQRERRRYAAGTGRRRRRHGDRHCHYGVRYRRERERRHLTRRFPLIVETLARLRSRSCIIDGVASFDLVRHQRANRSIFLYAFDLIELNGDDLRRDPLEVREATLASIVPKPHPAIGLNDHMGATPRPSPPTPESLASKASSRSARIPPTVPAARPTGSK